MTQTARQAAEALNPTLASAIRLAQEALSTRLRVAMPGVVSSFDQSTKLADVLPLIQYRLEGDADTMTGRTLPVIPRVPVVFPMTAMGGVYIPLSKGDPVVLLVSDRALDTWKKGALTPLEPTVLRQHDLTDCWAIPGGFPEVMAKGLPARFKNAVEVYLTTPVTKFAVGNGLWELIDLLTQLVLELSTHTHSSSGAGPPNDTASLAALYQKLLTFKAT